MNYRNLLSGLGLFAMLAVVSTAPAADWYTMTGGSLETTGGYDPNSGWYGNTNFHTKLMTSQTPEAMYTNAEGTGTGMLGLTYDNFEQFGEVVVSGTIPAGGLALSNQSYVQIGLITGAMITEAENWYLSGLFNDSIMVSIGQSSGNYSINVTDYNLGGGRRSPNLPFDAAQALAYELTINFDTDYASLMIDNGSGWVGPVGCDFGISDWGAAGYVGPHNPEDFTSAALFANMYNESDQLTGTATFGDVTVTPEPASAALLVLVGLTALRRR